jgi:hypothetical protein
MVTTITIDIAKLSVRVDGMLDPQIKLKYSDVR